MKQGKIAAIAALIMGAAVSASAGIVQGDIGKISRLRSYSTYGNGDVILWVQTPLAGCDGFWFRTTESNGKEMMAQLLSSQRSGSSTFIAAYDDQLWPGTGSRFCKIYSLDSLG